MRILKGQAGRFANLASREIRAGDQSQGRQGAGPRRAALIARHR
jgi:hypothetical protein